MGVFLIMSPCIKFLLAIPIDHVIHVENTEM